MSEVRLLIDRPASGAWNMAVDEALLETAATSRLTTLRLYEWQEPTLSLGYFQATADRRRHAASAPCPLVRRASGGGAIVHDRELTYSIAVPQHAAALGAAKELLNIVHETLLTILHEFGVNAALYSAATLCRGETFSLGGEKPFLCFQRRTCSDIVYKNAKIVGSAQRRRRGSILQHGSILLAQSSRAPELPGIAELTGGYIAPAEFARRWPPLLVTRLQANLRHGGLLPAESDRARRLAEERFATTEYSDRR